jgi:SAM-dependent methyltransferase
MSDRVAQIYDQFATYQWSRLDVRRGEFHVHLHHLDAFLPPASRVLDLGAGPGRYALELARRGHRVLLADLSPEQVRIARERIAAEEETVRSRIEGVELLDARDLSPLADGSFDAVVAFGPFYHLKAEGDRQRAAAEAARVLRPRGFLFAAFLPRPYWLGIALSSYLQQEGAPPAMLDHLASFWETGSLTRLKSGFLKTSHFCRLEEIDPLLAGAGLSRLRLVASNGIAAGWAESSWKELERRGVLDRALGLVLATAGEPSLLGMSDQVLWVGEKA